MKGRISGMNGTYRINIRPGLRVSIVLKADQRSGKLTGGIVKDILTSSAVHPHGIKVRLESGQVGRVKDIKGLRSLLCDMDSLPTTDDILHATTQNKTVNLRV